MSRPISEKMHYFHKLGNATLPTAFIGILAGCRGTDNTDSAGNDGDSSALYTEIVADGNLQGATLRLNNNGSKKLDTGEPSLLRLTAMKIRQQ